jgi:peptidoglycan/xylan/chitin deacetylase (PgdA/CDA1 family)
MRIYFSLFLLLAVLIIAIVQYKENPSITYIDDDTLSTINYEKLNARIVRECTGAAPGQWGQFVKGTDQDLVTNKKIMALTFDACGTKSGDGYDAELINYLRKEKIPATLFFTGLGIDANPENI